MLGLRVQTARGGKCCEYLCFCSRCRHILITFVGMTLLIVSYGVNTVQMSAEPSRNNVVSSVNNSGIHDDDDNGHANSRVVIMNGGNEGMNGNAHYWLHKVALPTPGQGDNGVYGTQKELLGRFTNFRKSRLFGLLGTNYSLSYNLTIGNSNSVANITVAAAPAPAYYYVPAPAPYYPYGYPYAYNPYAYNPYAYNPYGSYYYR